MRKLMMHSCFLGFLMVLLSSCKMDLYTSEYNDLNITNPTTSEKEVTFSGAAPAFVKASKATSASAVTVSWYSVEGAEYYEIARADSADGTYAILPETSSTTTLIDTYSLEKGKQYWYKVRGRTYNRTGEWSRVTRGSLLSITKPSASKGTYSGRIELTWDEVPDVYGYAIYENNQPYFNTSMEPVDTIHATGQDTALYRYEVSDEEAGESLYFAIRAISNNGSTQSDISVNTMGYSLVMGAPTKPEDVTAEQGVSPASSGKNSIKLKWKKDDYNYDYLIYRSAASTSDLRIYPSSSSVVASKDGLTVEDGYYIYTDNNSVTEGTRYTYTIIAAYDPDGSGTYVKGSPATVDGYLLSNPTDAKISLSRGTSGEPVQTITFTQPVGLDTQAARNAHAGWQYIIKASSIDGYSTDTTYQNIGSDDTFTWSYTGSTYQVFSVGVTNGSKETSPVSGLMVDAPGMPDGFSVSANEWASGMTANDHGIYPIRISWNGSNIISQYQIQRYAEGATINDDSIPLETLTYTVDSDMDVEGTRLTVDDAFASADAGEKYTYRVRCTDILGKTGKWSATVTGYGAITPKRLIHFWYIYAFKPFDSTTNGYLPASITNSFYRDFNLRSYWSPSNDGTIGWMVAQGKRSSLSDQMAALGSDTMACHYAHGRHKGSDHTSDGNNEDTTNFGTVYYTASTEGVGGQIYFTYSDFGELPWMYTSGKYEMHVDASGTGSAKSSGLSVKGMYPATVLLSNISVKSKDFVGNFVVVMSDGQPNGSVDSSVSANL